MFICKYSIFFLFISFTFGAKPNLDTIKKTEGFESTFYTKDSGLPYLSISYKSATSQRPKIGFLKFGISFLEIKNPIGFTFLASRSPFIDVAKFNDTESD